MEAYGKKKIQRIKTGILVHSSTSGTRIASYSSTPDTVTRRRPHTAQIKHEDLIINTLLKAKSTGLAENTLKSISYSLKQISKNADLNKPRRGKSVYCELELIQ